MLLHSLPMIDLHIETRAIHLSPLEQSLAKASASRHAMRLQLQSRLTAQLNNYTPTATLQLHPCTLQWMLMKYSEQLVLNPIEELFQWFNYSGGTFLQPGYPPLFYSRTQNQSISPNKSAIAAIGEAVAGFLAQRLYYCHKLARPNHDYPDVVMLGGSKTYLVEAKATVDSASAIQATVNEELLRMSAYVSACAELDHRPIVGLLVGTALESEQTYRCYLSEVRLCL